jgi:hypothetical protein
MDTLKLLKKKKKKKKVPFGKPLVPLAILLDPDFARAISMT